MAKPELRDHRKFLKLMRMLGEIRPHVRGYLDCMWERGYQTGSPIMGDELDVEAAAEYPGEPGKFAKAALESGFLDIDDTGRLVIHDLYDHAPEYAKKRMRRMGTAPKSGQTASETPNSRTNGAQNDESDAIGTEKVGDGLHNPNPNPNPNQEPKPKAENKQKPARAVFVPPAVDDVREYCRERGNDIDPEAFVDFYASKGWKVGDQPMRDWKACVRTWEKRSRDSPRAPPPGSRSETRTDYAKRTLAGILEDKPCPPSQTQALPS